MGNDKTKIIVLILIVVVAFAFVIKGACKKPGARTRDRALLCTSCNHQFVQKIKSGQEEPFKCPNCKKKAAYYAWQCRDCEAVFKRPERPKPEMDAPPAMEPPTHQCPECGNYNVGPMPSGTESKE